MGTSANQQGWSGKWLDVLVLVFFVGLCLGGLASIFLSSSIGLALTQFFIGLGGLLVNVILTMPKILGRWRQMVQGWFGTLLRIAVLVLLVLTISLQAIIIFGNPFSPPRGGIFSDCLTLTPTLSPMLTSSPTPGPPSVLITTPTGGSQVSILTTVQGTAHNIPKDEELWLFIVPQGSTGYFPQPGPIPISNEQWSTDGHFGGESEVGLRFTLIPVLINQNDQVAHCVIAKYFHQPPPGPYQSIPRTGGMQLLSPEVTVIRV